MPEIEALKRQRSTLSSRLASIQASRTRLTQAESAEQIVIAAIADLSRSEIDTLREWTRTGEGLRPVPNVEGRRQLHDRLVEAQLAAEAARGVHADLDAEQREVASDLAIVEGQLEDATLDRLAERHAVEMRNLDAYIVQHLLPRMALHLALHGLFTGMAREHQTQGQIDQATRLFQRAEALQKSYVQFEATPTNGAVVEKIATWQARFDELLADPPADNVVALPGAAA